MAVSMTGDTPDKIRRDTTMWGAVLAVGAMVMLLAIALGLLWLVQHPSFGARCAPHCIAVTGNPGAPGLRAQAARRPSASPAFLDVSSLKLAGAAPVAPASFSEERA